MKRTELRRKTPMPKGSGPLPRRTPLERGGQLTRSAPIKKRNARRKASRFPHRRDPKYCAWIRSLECVAASTEAAGRRFNAREVAGGKEPILAAEAWLILFGVRDCRGPVECAHVVSCGAGGNDVANTVPLCRSHHRQQHDKGIATFQRLYSLDLPVIAAALACHYPGSPASPGSTPETPAERPQ